MAERPVSSATSLVRAEEEEEVPAPVMAVLLVGPAGDDGEPDDEAQVAPCLMARQTAPAARLMSVFGLAGHAYTLEKNASLFKLE